MAQAPATVAQVINALYVDLYQDGATGLGLAFWANSVGMSPAQALVTTATVAQQTALGQGFVNTQLATFNATYGALNDVQFVTQLYANAAGNTAGFSASTLASGIQYWFSLLQTAELAIVRAANPGVADASLPAPTAAQITQARAGIVGQFVDNILSFDLTQGQPASGLTPADFAAAVVIQGNLQAKITISQFLSDATQQGAGTALTVTAIPSANFTAELALIAAANPSNVGAIEAAIANSAAAGNLAATNGINTFLGTVTSGQTFNLTVGVDTATDNNAGKGNGIVNSPIGQNPFFLTPADTLNTGDNITLSGPNNVLNATFVTGSTIVATIQGVQTYNFTNIGGTTTLQGNNVGGVTTVNSVNSTGSINLGTAAAPLNTAVTTVGMTNTNARLTISELAAALAGATDALLVNASNAGTKGNAAQVQVGANTAATSGVENWTVASTGTAAAGNFVELGVLQGNSATTLTVTGTAKVEVSAANNGDFATVTTIDGTANTGGVTITGRAGSGSGNAGFLNNNTVLTSAKFGSANDSIDVSNMTAAQVAALTADGGAGTADTFIVDSTLVAATTSATTFAKITNFENLGLRFTGATTIDMTKIPASFNTITYTNNSNGLTINKLATALTVNEGTFGAGAALTVGAVTPNPGLTDVFNLIVGAGNNGGTVTLLGEEVVTLTANGTAPLTNPGQTATFGGGFTVTSTLGGAIGLTIAGTENVTMGTNGAAVGLTLNATGGGSTVVTDTLANVLTLNQFNGASTNAQRIDAGASGGLVMNGFDSNFTANVNAAASFGDVITGSATKANTIYGSLGNDALKGGAAGDTFWTDGGGDAVTLGAAGKVDVIHVSGGLTTALTTAVSIIDGTDKAQAGTWGLGTTATASYIFKDGGGAGVIFDSTAVSNAGVSTDQTTIANFSTGATGDVVDFHINAWQFTGGANGNGGSSISISSSNGAFPATGPAVIGFQDVGTVVANNVDLIVLNQGTFANATAVAAALHGVGPNPYVLTLGVTLADKADLHILVAYNDTTGNTHIADVDFDNHSGAATTGSTGANVTLTTTLNEYVSDMVQLTGVTAQSLVGANVVFV